MHYTIPSTTISTLDRATLDLLRDTLAAAGEAGVLSVLQPLSSNERQVEFLTSINVLRASSKTPLDIRDVADTEPAALAVRMSGICHLCARAIEANDAVVETISRQGGKQNDALTYANLHFLPGGTLLAWDHAGIDMSLEARRQAEDRGDTPASDIPGQAQFSNGFHAFLHADARPEDRTAFDAYATSVVPHLLARTAVAWNRPLLAHEYRDSKVEIA